MPWPQTPGEEAALHRRVRNSIFDSGGQLYGDKRINPQRKRTAYEYDQWTKTQPSHSIHEGAYRDMLEAEERSMGQSSYPEGHPRREQAMSGIPHGPEVRPDAGPTMPAPERGSGFPAGVDPGRLIRAGAGDRVPVRPNRFTKPCAHCGEKVLPGEGRLERQPTRWVTVHHPSCPN